MDVSFTSDSEDEDDKKTSPSSSDAEQTRPSAVQSVDLIVPPQPPAIEDDDDAETVTFTLTLPSVTNNTVATPPVNDSTSKTADENVTKTSKSLSKKSSKTDVTNGGSSETISNGEKTTEADAVSSTKKSTKSKKSSKVLDAVMDDKTTAINSMDDSVKSTVTEGGEQTVTTIKKKKVKSANLNAENGDETATKTKKKSKPITEVEPLIDNTAVENTEPVAAKKSKSPEKLANDAEQKSDETSEGKEEKPKKKKVSSRKAAAEAMSPDDAANDAAPEIGEKVVIKKKKVKKVSATPTTEASDAPLIVTTTNEAEISQPATSKGEEAVEIPAKKFTEVTEERLASVEKVEAVVAVQEVEPEATSYENKVTIAEIISDEKPSITAETEQAKPSEVVKETPTALDSSVGNDVTVISAATPLVDIQQVAVEESHQMAEGQSTATQETVQITPSAKPEDVVTAAADSTPILNGPSKLDEKESLSVSESAGESTRENEESDFTYRRKSMDDFIKRILAEAREEQQKRMLVLSNDNSAASVDVQKSMEPTSSFGDKDQSMLDRRLASTERKVLNGDQPLSSKTVEKDLDEDLAEIGRYFTKRNPVNKYDVDLDSNDELLGRRLTRLGNDDDILRKIEGDSYVGLTKQQSSNHSEDSFVPRRREETADVVRSSIRPVRAVIEQQTDVIQQFKITSRGMDELEAEIRNLRETFLDRQARIETMRSAIDAENRLYEAEQNAANDRINQQKVPGGRFVREDFMASVGASSRGLFDDSYRRRSGSVSGRSTPSRVLPRDNTVSASWRNADDDASSTTSSYSRSRRGGSVARERTYTFDDLLGDSSRSTTPRLYSTFETPSTSTTYTSSTVNTDDLLSGRGFTTLSSLNAATSSYLSPDTRSSYSTDYRPSSSYLSSGTGAGSNSYSSYSSSLSSTDPSRFRRAQSVSDVSYDRYSGGDGGSSSGYGSSSGGEFQSRFLSKVRSKKSGDDSGDRQFKSRFLRNTYNNDVRRYMSGSRGGQD